MFNYRKLGETAAAAVLAVMLSAVSVGAAVGPAQSVEVSAPAASARA